MCLDFVKLMMMSSVCCEVDTGVLCVLWSWYWGPLCTVKLILGSSLYCEVDTGVLCVLWSWYWCPLCAVKLILMSSACYKADSDVHDGACHHQVEGGQQLHFRQLLGVLQQLGVPWANRSGCVYITSVQGDTEKIFLLLLMLHSPLVGNSGYFTRV